MSKHNTTLEEILRLDMEEIEIDFSTTRSFNEAVAKAKKQITKSFDEAIAATEKPKIAVTIKEADPV